MELTFRPNRSLAWRGAVATLRDLWSNYPVLGWILLIAPGAFALGYNLLQTALGRNLPLYCWWASLLLGPVLILIEFASLYLCFRLCGNFTLRPRNPATGRWRMPPLRQPATCHITTFSSDPRVHCLEIKATTPLRAILGARHTVMLYSALTDDLVEAEAFAKAFRQQYPPASA